MKSRFINHFRWIVFIGLWIIMFGCKTPENKCEFDQLCPVDSIQMPDSLKLGETANLRFLVGIGNGCGNFDRLDINSDTTLKRYEIFSYARFKGCVCTEIYAKMWQSHSFTPSQTGQFTLIFPQPNSAAIKRYIQVY